MTTEFTEKLTVITNVAKELGATVKFTTSIWLDKGVRFVQLEMHGDPVFMYAIGRGENELEAAIGRGENELEAASALHENFRKYLHDRISTVADAIIAQQKVLNNLNLAVTSLDQKKE